MTDPHVARAIGVVIPNFNKRDFIAETIRSVLAQTHERVRLVVVDDGSTDDSLDVIRELTDGTDVDVITLENGGVSRARNVGFEALRGSVDDVLFLDSDDVLEPDALAVLSEHLAQHPEAVAVYAQPVLVDEFGTSLGADPDTVRWEPHRGGRRRIAADTAFTPLEAIYSRFRVLPSATLVRSAAFERTGGWDSGLCRPARPFHAEDKDMAVQLALLGEVHRLPVTTYHYRILPTAHRAALYEGLRELDRKWYHAPLDRASRRRVRRAIAFDRRVAAIDALGTVRDAVRAREAWRSAVVDALRHIGSAALVRPLIAAADAPAGATAFPPELVEQRR